MQTRERRNRARREARTRNRKEAGRFGMSAAAEMIGCKDKGCDIPYTFAVLAARAAFRAVPGLR
jgi:hypothetical protein